MTAPNITSSPLHLLLRRWLWIGGAGFVVAVATFAILSLQEAMYKATVVLTVSPSAEDSIEQPIEFYQSLAEAPEMIDGLRTEDNGLRRVQLEELLAERFSVELRLRRDPGRTQIPLLMLTVRDPASERAVAVANAWAQRTLTRSSELEMRTLRTLADDLETQLANEREVLVQLTDESTTFVRNAQQKVDDATLARDTSLAVARKAQRKAMLALTTSHTQHMLKLRRELEVERAEWRSEWIDRGVVLSQAQNAEREKLETQIRSDSSQLTLDQSVQRTSTQNELEVPIRKHKRDAALNSFFRIYSEQLGHQLGEQERALLLGMFDDVLDRADNPDGDAGGRSAILAAVVARRTALQRQIDSLRKRLAEVPPTRVLESSMPDLALWLTRPIDPDLLKQKLKREDFNPVYWELLAQSERLAADASVVDQAEQSFREAFAEIDRQEGDRDVALRAYLVGMALYRAGSANVDKADDDGARTEPATLRSEFDELHDLAVVAAKQMHSQYESYLSLRNAVQEGELKLARLESDMALARAALEEEALSKRSLLTNRHTLQLDALKLEQEDSRETLEADHSDRLATLAQQHENELEELRDAQAVEIESLTRTGALSITEAESRLADGQADRLLSREEVQKAINGLGDQLRVTREAIVGTANRLAIASPAVKPERAEPRGRAAVSVAAAILAFLLAWGGFWMAAVAREMSAPAGTTSAASAGDTPLATSADGTGSGGDSGKSGDQASSG